MSATKAIRDATVDGLAAAKGYVDSVLDGEDVIIECRSLEAAGELCSALRELGWISRQLPE